MNLTTEQHRILEEWKLGKRKNLPSNIRIEQIKDLVGLGIHDEEVIGEKLGLSPPWVRRTILKKRILLRRKPGSEKGTVGKVAKNKSLVDLMLFEYGYGQNDVAKVIGAIRSGIYVYIHEDDERYRIWKEKNIEFRKNKKKLSLEKKLSGSVAEPVVSINANLLAHKRVERYFSGIHKYDYAKALDIFNFLRLYYFNKERGKKISVKNLIDQSSLHRNIAYGVLDELFEETSVRFFTKADEDIIKELFNLKMTIVDISYFSGIERSCLNKRFRKIGERPNYSIRPPHRTRSEIFKELDTGLDTVEICYRFNLKDEKLGEIMDFRGESEREIILALDMVHPGKIHTKPYF